jgi:hypothetical protein
MSTAFAHVIAPQTQQPRSRAFWMVLGALVAGQLFAFWLLCVHQVRVAEARNNQALVQQMALADCLQYIPGSTIASCSARVSVAQMQAQQMGGPPSSVQGAVPVSYSYR